MRFELFKKETTVHSFKPVPKISKSTDSNDHTTRIIQLNSKFCNIINIEKELIGKLTQAILKTTLTRCDYLKRKF